MLSNSIKIRTSVDINFVGCVGTVCAYAMVKADKLECLTTGVQIDATQPPADADGSDTGDNIYQVKTGHFILTSLLRDKSNKKMEALCQ